MNSSKKNKRYIYLIIIIALFLFLRISFLLTNIDPIFAYEERTNGCIAKDIIDNKLKMPFYDYQAYPHSGGTLVSGILTVPLFFLFGTSLFSLKLLPILFSLGTLFLWYKFLYEHFSQSTAIIFSILFILSPPFYTKASLIAWGNHCESGFFSILSIVIFFKIFLMDNEENLKKNGYLVLFGLLSGISMYFSYIYFVTLITLFILWFALNKSFFLKKNFILYLITSVLGFSPWIGYNLYQLNSNGFALFSKPFIAKIEQRHSINYFLKKFYWIVFRDIPFSFGFEIAKFKNVDIISYIYHFIFLFLFVVMSFFSFKSLFKELKDKKNKGNMVQCVKELLPVTYIVSFISIFTLSGLYNPKIVEFEWFDVSKYRYYSPLYPFIFIAIVLGMRMVWKEYSGSFAKVFLIFSFLFLITAGLYSNLKFIKFNQFGKCFALKGYYYDELLPRYIKNHSKNLQEINYLIGRIDRRYIPDYYELIGTDFGEIFKNNIFEVVKVIDRTEPENRKYLYSGIGRACISLFKKDFSKSIIFIEKIPEPYRGFCYQGLTYEAVMQFHRYSSLDKGSSSEWDISEALGLIGMVDDRYKPSCYFGLGRGIMSFEFYYAESRMYLFSDLVMKSGKAIKEVEDKYKEFCFQGIGIEYGRKALGYFFVRSYFQPEHGYGLENKFYLEALKNEIGRIMKGEKTLDEGDRKSYYKGIKMAVDENFKDVKVVNFILNKINERKVL